jgi:hypothetical protein
MSKKERRLIRHAAKALMRLDQYRKRHTPSATDATFHHVYVSARLAGWPDAGAREVALHILRAGITALAPHRMFGECERRVQ